ncbi:hypothetical protein BaRGS_00017201, partial [Batillaria attramentaria]
MKFDELVTILGEFGPYQKRVYFLLCLPAITGCMQTLVYVFTMGVPQHRCALPGLEQDTYEPQNPHHAAVVNASIPPNDFCHVIVKTLNVTSLTTTAELAAGSMNGVHGFAGSAYNSSDGSNKQESDCDDGLHINSTGSGCKLATCSRYVFDKSNFQETVVTQMGLVCEKRNNLAHAQMLFMLGSLFATAVCQPLSDIYGRKAILLACLALHAIVSLAITWSTYFTLLCALMFLSNLAITGMFGNAFVIGIELVGPSKRVWAGYVVEIFWSLGMILLAPIAFLLRDWQHLQMATSILPFGFLSYYWLIPESPRWLLSRGRIHEAETIIRTAAKVNKVTLPAGVLDAMSLAVEKRESVLGVCRHPVLVFRCVVIFYSCLAFYGLALNVGHLSGNIYLNFFLTGITELAVYGLCLGLLDRVGRRLLNSGLMLVAGVSCTLTVFTVLYASASMQWITTALAMVGRMGIAGGFATIYLYTSELYPTVVRNSAMGASSFFARIGSVISPYIANLSTMIGGDVGTAAPLLIFGLSSILAGCLLLTLPETLNRRLPETVDDAVSFAG